MRLNNILLILFGGAIILHLFSLITIPSLYKEEDTRYNELLYEYDSLNTVYNNVSNEYNKYKDISDSIIAYYNNKYDSTKQANNNIIKSYETILKDLNDITIVDNDSVTEYISKRIYNR